MHAMSARPDTEPRLRNLRLGLPSTMPRLPFSQEVPAQSLSQLLAVLRRLDKLAVRWNCGKLTLHLFGVPFWEDLLVKSVGIMEHVLHVLHIRRVPPTYVVVEFVSC